MSPMTKDNRASGRPSSTGASGARNPGAADATTILDYGLVDLADDFFPNEVSNCRLRKPHALPNLFG
jgi:hypothetical protein